jgi:hypothetical protein
MPDDGCPSATLLRQALGRHLDEQRTHFDSLDTKAGVVVGFAGVIAALSLNRDAGSLPAKVGVGFAVVAAIVAMAAFWPRKHPVFDPRRLRGYLRAEASFTELRLLDTEIEMSVRASKLITAKAGWLKCSLCALLLAVVALAIGTLRS